MEKVTTEEQFNIQKELLEITIKAGRRLMHDFDHLLNEVPQDNEFKKDYEDRAKMWRVIFYPDDGSKNYRTKLHQTIIHLEVQLGIAQKLLKELGIDPEPNLPY